MNNEYLWFLFLLHGLNCYAVVIADFLVKIIRNHWTFFIVSWQSTFSYDIFKYGDDEEHFSVIGNEDKSDSRCSCCMMEFVGLPCCHLLAFFNYFGIQKLPNSLIKDRWKRGKKDGIKVDIYDDGNIDENVDSYIELSCLTNKIVGIAMKTKPLI